MTVTNTYSLGSPTAFAFSDGLFSNNLGSIDLTSLSNGGIAFAGDHVGYGHVDVGAGGGSAAQSVSTANGSNAAIDQLKNGNLAVVSQYNGDIYWQLTDSNGYSLGFNGHLGSVNSSNVDVAGLTGGRFAVAYQRDFGGGDQDIEISIHNPSGALITGFAVSGSSDNDENASISGLQDGGFVVAWDRNAGGPTSAWFAIYNSDGTVRVAPHVADAVGNDNTAMSVVGLQKGGFAVAYVDSGWTGSDHITVAIYKANGAFVQWVDVAAGTGMASEPSLTVLADGTLAVSWTSEFSPTDHDIYMQLVDPKTGALLLGNAEGVVTDGSNEHGSSITALGDGQVLLAWENDSSGAQGGSVQLYIDHEGDGAKNHIYGKGAFDTINGFGSSDVLKGGGGDDTINGGDGKDVINGQAGHDELTGGAGKDTFQFTDINDITTGDLITDLENKDRINLAHIDADTGTAGNQAFHIVASFSGAAAEMKIDYNITHAGQTTLQFDVNGDGVSDGEIVISGDHHTFTNFVL